MYNFFYIYVFFLFSPQCCLLSWYLDTASSTLSTVCWPNFATPPSTMSHSCPRMPLSQTHFLHCHVAPFPPLHPALSSPQVHTATRTPRAVRLTLRVLTTSQVCLLQHILFTQLLKNIYTS